MSKTLKRYKSKTPTPNAPTPNTSTLYYQIKGTKKRMETVQREREKLEEAGIERERIRRELDVNKKANARLELLRKHAERIKKEEEEEENAQNGGNARTGKKRRRRRGKRTTRKSKK